jgi:DNA-binding transcriptional regulator GbsR (MarR family)
MDVDEISEDLFGRYQALRLYMSIARLAKDEFSTGQIASITGISSPSISKELARLDRLGFIKRTSRRGDYQRITASAFWSFVSGISDEAPST